MKREKLFIVGQVLLATTCEEEYNRLHLIDPVPETKQDFINEGLDTPKMYVHDIGAIKAEEIEHVFDSGFGYVKIQTKHSWCEMRGDVQTLLNEIHYISSTS